MSRLFFQNNNTFHLSKFTWSDQRIVRGTAINKCIWRKSFHHKYRSLDILIKMISIRNIIAVSPIHHALYRMCKCVIFVCSDIAQEDGERDYREPRCKIAYGIAKRKRNERKRESIV